MATGDIQITKFREHLKISVSQEIKNKYYSSGNLTSILNQTNYADWFYAKLKTAANGGSIDTPYIIYCPTDSSGTALTAASPTYPNAKVCAAPNPPFNQGETPRSFYEILEELNNSMNEMLSLRDK